MPPQGDLDFSPAAAVDGIAETAWAAEFTESGAPPRLTVDLGLRRRVTAIELVPGCGADEAAWAMNPRLARVRLLGRDSHRAFDVPDLPFRGRHRIAWDSEVKTLTLEAQQVHGLGKVACISELRVHAEPIQPQQSLEPVLVALFDLSCADAWSAWASARGHDPAKRSVTRGAIELWRSADTDHLASATLECFDADVQDPICSAQVAEILASFGEPASPQRAPNTLVYRWPGGVGEIEWDEDGRTPVAVSLRCAHPRLKGHER